MALRSFVALQLVYLGRCHPGTWDGKVIMNENGAELPDLSGVWTGDDGDFQLRLFQPPKAPCAAPNSSYARLAAGSEQLLETCTLTPIYDYDTRHRLDTTIRCRGAEEDTAGYTGSVTNRSHVVWRGKSPWMRKGGTPQNLGHYATSKVKKVHVVFMNHYDVGYTDYINGVDNKYMHEYYASAAATAQKMRAAGLGNFTYTTHPWLMQRFLMCPCASDEGSSCLARSLNNSFEKPLSCPTAEEIANFSAAARRGDIAWNAAPFNIQPENMAPELFEASFDLAKRMDQRFGRQATRTMSIRDVIYVTRAVLPHLKKQGITGLTIGSNGADYPPQVPKLHRWVDELSGTDIVVAYHAYGYGGYGLKDCAEAPNGVVLCTEFRTDNRGPPANTSEVLAVLTNVSKEYPGAQVISSTFDAFFADVQEVREELPTVNLEVADTWTYGNPSDPLKMAQYRAIQRAWIRCRARGEVRCAVEDPAIQNMTWFLLKAPEHTWGTPGISGWGKGGDYNTSLFRHDLTNETYMRAAASWTEQRIFNELAARALEEGPAVPVPHPLAEEVRNELRAVEDVPTPTVPASMVEVSGSTRLRARSGAQLELGADGSIIHLELPCCGIWATSDSPLGAYTYQTFNDTEWKPFTYAYLNDHAMQTGFCKPGSNNFSESRIWRPTLKHLWISGAASAFDFAVAELRMPRKSSETYGAPHTIFLNISASRDSLDMDLVTVGKLPTMIGESSSVAFRPAPALKSHSGSAWRLQKLGQEIDPEGVQDGGNQYTHGVWGGATVNTAHGQMTMDSWDAINMSPITPDFPIGNPLPASYHEDAAKAGKGLSRLAAGSVKGMAVNLHNNLWNTNYALYYPFFDPRFCASPLQCSNSNALWRFRLNFVADTIYV